MTISFILTLSSLDLQKNDTFPEHKISPVLYFKDDMYWLNLSSYFSMPVFLQADYLFE